jgi:CheY-like chemotaxis protein
MKVEAPTIVLVERDEVTLALYQRELHKSFVVLPFTEVKEVLETIARGDVVAVVIEPEIGAGQGWELIHSIRSIFPSRDIPVIVCTTRDASAATAAADVSRYLTKPVLPKTLRAVTLEVLGMRETPQARP